MVFLLADAPLFADGSLLGVPQFVGVPGGAELLVLLLIAVVVFGLPVVLVGGGLYLYRKSQSDRPATEELRALRREVERLREDLDRLDDGRVEDGRPADERLRDEELDERLRDDEFDERLRDEDEDDRLREESGDDRTDEE